MSRILLEVPLCLRRIDNMSTHHDHYQYLSFRSSGDPIRIPERTLPPCRPPPPPCITSSEWRTEHGCKLSPNRLGVPRLAALWAGFMWLNPTFYVHFNKLKQWIHFVPTCYLNTHLNNINGRLSACWTCVIESLAQLMSPAPPQPSLKV